MKQAKYQRWHDQIIERAQKRCLDCYSEWHHIIPRSLGGSNASANLVQLTYREHFLVHWLLTKIYIETIAHNKMLAALAYMTRNVRGHQRIISGWQFDLSKRTAKGIKRPPETGQRISKANKGRKWSLASREAVSIQRKGQPGNPKALAAMLASRIGVKHSDKTKAQMSATAIANGQGPSEACLAASKAANTGRKHTPEAKELCRVAAVKYWAEKKAAEQASIGS